VKNPLPLVIAAVLASAAVLCATAETIVVTNGNDQGPGSLREAIAIAEGNGESDEIVFDGDLTVMLDNPITDRVYSHIVIKGSGVAQTTIDCSGVTGGFDAVLEVWAPGSLTLVDLTIQNSGHRIVIATHRGLLTVESCWLKDNAGPALYLDNTEVVHVAVVDSLFTGNYADGIGGAISCLGGLLEVDRCAFIGNSSAATFDGGGALAATFGSTHVIVRNSTFSGNHAETRGGAVHLYGGALVELHNVTFAGNTTPGPGQDIFSEGSTVRLSNTIIDGGCGTIYGGQIVTLGHNLEQGDTCGLMPGLGDLVDVDALLGPLQDNGGPTPTHALLLGSPAIDTGDVTCPVTHDQRGMPRPINGSDFTQAACDIGAVEYQRMVFYDGLEGGNAEAWGHVRP